MVRNIDFHDIDEVIENLEVIEKYPDDVPYCFFVVEMEKVILGGEKNGLADLKTWQNG